MADSTISQLPAAITIGGTDLIPIDQGGVTKKAQVSLLGLLTLNIVTGKTLTVLNSLTLAGTDSTSMLFPSTSATIARIDAAQTFAGTQTFIATINGSINGNAATATVLQTARAINGTSFNGSADITVPVNNTNDTTTNATMYPLWTATAGGNYAAKVSSTKLTFNPSSGLLTATGFSGPLSGNVTGNLTGDVTGNVSGSSGSTTGNAGTATALQTGRTIDGTTFDGTVNIVVVAPAIHAATNKTTPVDADEFGIWDSVSTLLNHVTWANIKATLLGVIAGKAVQVDQVVTSWTRAATTTLGTSLNGTISDTSTTITAFNGVAGVTYHVRALGAGQITHNATDLIITQGGADRITAAGDTFDVEMITATTCRVKNYITSAGLIADIGAAIHAATNKTTPVDADEVGIWDSVSGLLNHVTWANLKTTLGSTFAALAGSAGQVFSVATPTSAAHAVRLDFFSPITASLGANVALNNTANYFDGPSIAQGNTGTWYVSGNITLVDGAGSAQFFVKLWDGTTVIASSAVASHATNVAMGACLSGYITNPAGNLRISVRDVTSTNGTIIWTGTGEGKDAVIFAIRVG